MNKKLKLRIIEIYGSQAEFSMRVPDEESIISRIINGRRGLSEERKALWAKVLKCKVGDIFSE